MSVVAESAYKTQLWLWWTLMTLRGRAHTHGGHSASCWPLHDPGTHWPRPGTHTFIHKVMI